ncbi:molybdopterin-dependent oxidoreductase [Patulibacter sp.]|uniref:molybdopterin-dependent oxidoreductase n=1 Tax=Patulibacter sp. TaxID=1912859 RepID=UPI00271E0844|nr:molybdopterin-dependent oxidoreductase [Patulibacter sp.]MDO9408224.1 molybdopterin-dependent oxidoreductase [Patulibacter sp.]
MSAPLPTPDDAEGRPVGRRAFLGIVGVGVSSLLWGGVATRWLSDASSALPSSLQSVVPGGTGWRIYSVNPPFPTYDPTTWRLTVDGLVERPRTFTMAQLQALPRADQTTDFHCVTGWSVPDVHWAGVRFADLLAAVGVSPAAGAIEFASAEEPYVDSLTLEQARAPDAMLAYEMDHGPISREHGAPARLVVPQMYGYKGVKWVSRITLTAQASDGYWEQRGYDRDAYVGGSNGV